MSQVISRYGNSRDFTEEMDRREFVAEQHEQRVERFAEAPTKPDPKTKDEAVDLLLEAIDCGATKLELLSLTSKIKCFILDEKAAESQLPF